MTLWTVAGQAPLSTGIFKEEYWSGLAFPPPGDLSPGIEPTSPVYPALQANSSLPTEPLGKPLIWGCGNRACLYLLNDQRLATLSLRLNTSSEDHGDTDTNLRACYEDLAKVYVK